MGLLMKKVTSFISFESDEIVKRSHGSLLNVQTSGSRNNIRGQLSELPDHLLSNFCMPESRKNAF